MTIVAHSRQYVIGVDCHTRTHTYAIIETRTGPQMACEQFPTSSAGVARAIAWAGQRTGGDADTLWVIEGVASYAARLAHTVTDAGCLVVEAPRMNARGCRGVGKSDPLDAQTIAATVLSLDETQLRQPRQDQGVRAALRTVVAARDQLTQERTMNINALTALVRVNDLGVDARRPLMRIRPLHRPLAGTGRAARGGDRS